MTAAAPAEDDDVEIGSADHQALSAMRRSTDDPYEPAILDRPVLDPEARERPVELPTRNLAGQMMPGAARHLLFFPTWTAWHRARLPWWRKPILDARRPGGFARLIWRRALIARGTANNFTAAGHRPMGIKVRARAPCSSAAWRRATGG